MQYWVVIVAGGRGTRMNSSVPKQFMTIGEKPLLFHTFEAFLRFDPDIKVVLVLPSDLQARFKQMCIDYQKLLPYRMTAGGESRFESVRNGLAYVPDDCIVAIHDAARPFVSSGTIQRCFDAAAVKGSAVPVIHPFESIRYVEGHDSYPVERNNVRMVQTPQVFQSNMLHEAYNQTTENQFTDDAGVVESAGYSVHLVEGNSENIKITTPFDIQYAEFLLQYYRKEG